jgi:hypothetical protein
MHINATINVDLDDEQADEVIVQVLKKDYIRLNDEHQELLASLETLEDYQKEDMSDIESWMGAIETLFKYYMYVRDAEEFIRGVKGVYIKE